MFVAINQSGQKFSLLDQHSFSQLQGMRQSERFFCEVCGGELLLKLGTQVAWHFAHKSTRDCPLEHESESLAHQLGKKNLYLWMKEQGEAVTLEHYLPNIGQRADLLVGQHPPLALEYQCSTIPIEQLVSRTQGYSTEGIQVVWILGGDRERQITSITYKLLPMDFLTHRRLTTTSRPILLYYHPFTDCFTLLELYYTLTATQFIAMAKSFPRSILSSHIFLHQNLPPLDTKLIKKTWLQQKERWRTKVLFKFNQTERYLYGMCKNTNKVFSCFPAYIGLPVRSSVYLATPTYLWQMWLVIKFMSGPRGMLIHIQQVTQAFEKMVKKKIFSIRSALGDIPTVHMIIKDYFNVLCDLHILHSLNDATYQLIGKLEWQIHDLDMLLKRDDEVLTKIMR